METATTRQAARREAFRRVREWTRGRFALPEAATVLVSEMVCALPGCPPLETHVMFVPPGGKRHHFKVFKPVGEILPDDLPYAWLKDTLIVPEGAGCDCC